MAETLESLKRKMTTADELLSVIKTMKAIAASNIVQYESARITLNEYYRSIALGTTCCIKESSQLTEKDRPGCLTEILLLGTDQGLVGRFNDSLASFAVDIIRKIKNEYEIWTMGERMADRLRSDGFVASKKMLVPSSLSAITNVVNIVVEGLYEKVSGTQMSEFVIIYNHSTKPGAFEPMYLRLLPFDDQWADQLKKSYQWPTKLIPEVIGDEEDALSALIQEYLFVSIYHACAESLACESTCRLKTMERAEKNIDELLEGLNNDYQELRQSSIDEELFDIISGFEAQKKKPVRNFLNKS